MDFPYDALLALGLIVLFIVGGRVSYVRAERKRRERWIVRAEPTGEGEVAELVRERAPEPVRTLAQWSIYMGQMSIPGGLLGLLALMAAGLGVVAIPGMILAIRIWRLAYWLLDRDPRAAQEARTLATFAVILNVIAIVVGIVVAIGIGTNEILLLPKVLIIYGAVSFAHAYAMHDCAGLLATYDSDDGRNAPAPWDPLSPAPEPVKAGARAG